MKKIRLPLLRYPVAAFAGRGLRGLIAGCALALLPLTAQCVIPQPQTMVREEGSFTLTPDTTVVVASAQLGDIGRYLSGLLSPATGMSLKTKSSRSIRSNAITLRLDASLGELGEEGYRLRAGPDGVVITAGTPAGVFYGVQTFRQLLPDEIESPRKVDAVAWTIPAVRIEDQPRFRWRGFLLDPARHFRTKGELERYIDLIAMQKFNVLQLHLTDNEGWRVQIDRYPKLTEVGARVPDYSGNRGEGWFYTKKDLRDIVKYAASRYVMVVPEFETPGHSAALTASYPELSCSGQPVMDGQPVRELCVNRAGTFDFVRNVIDELLPLFPSPYFHVGADEVTGGTWRACESCRQDMAALMSTPLPADVVVSPANVMPYDPETGLGVGGPLQPDIARLQGEYVRKIDEYLSSKGRRMVAWDEILDGGLKRDSRAMIMVWRGAPAITAATSSNRDVVVALYPEWYLDIPNVSLQRTYDYEPIPAGLPADQEKRVIGVQACMWGEVSTSLDAVDEHSFPRLPAVAEIAWSTRSNRNFQNFSGRLPSLLRRLDLLGVKHGAP